MKENKIFANKNLNNIKNNESFCYIKNNEEKINNNIISVKKKINSLLNKDYVYKTKVNIVTNDGSFDKYIVGRNSKYLITIDNELIPISSIIDISI